eukprot:1249302-Pyramimonas_sp.AAC.1
MDRAARAVVAAGWRVRAPRAIGAREGRRSSSESGGGGAPCCAHACRARTASSYTCNAHFPAAECLGASTVSW